MEGEFSHVQSFSPELIEVYRTNMRAPVDPLKRVEITRYYLGNKGRLRKTANAFGVSRQIVSVIVKPSPSNWAQKYAKLPFTEPEA